MEAKDILKNLRRNGYMNRRTYNQLVYDQEKFFEDAEILHQALQERLQRERMERRL